MSDEHDWSGYAASFALDALDAEERQAFVAHLDECAACRAEVQAYRETAAALAQGVPVRVPPASLRARVLADAKRVRPIATVGGEVGDAARAGAPGSASAPASLRGRARTGWLAAAAIIVAVALGALWLSERGARQDLEQRITRVTEDAAARSARIAELDAALARSDSLLAAILAPDIRTVRLAAQGRPPAARIWWNQARGQVVIATFDLPPAPAGRTYQLWGIAGGRAPASLGTFNTAADGRAVVTFIVDPGFRFDVAAITEEPAGGSPQPTMTPFLVGGVTTP
jgi:anti-sigma-K factor RskA